MLHEEANNAAEADVGGVAGSRGRVACFHTSFSYFLDAGIMREYGEKLVIEWGMGKLAWRQRAHKENNKDVLEIRRVAKEEPFPRYANFLQRLGDLNNVYPSWRRSLQEKGVYLLVFDDGRQYVGSATGEGGFLQRWENYLATGHGGNEVLKRDHRDAKQAMVSILEVSGSTETDQEIINREMFWKKKLGPGATPLEPAQAR